MLLEFTTTQLQVNDLNFHVIDEGNGPAVLLLHGFPNTSTLWRHQISALVKAGYRAIVPDQRGFGQSDKPREKSAYSLPNLASDAIGILDELNVNRAHVIAHDWGSAVGWVMGALYPNRMERFIPMSVGHPSVFTDFTIEQLRRSWYILMFQFENIAEDMVMKNDWALFKEWSCHHEDTEEWIEQLSEQGALTAGLNWYRANLDPVALPAMPLQLPAINVPTFGIWSSDDPLLTEEQMKRSGEKVLSNWKYKRVEAGHWLQLDEPELLNRLIIEYFNEELE